MNGQTLDKIVALENAYGPWALVGAAVVVIAYLLIRRGFSFSVQMDVGRKR